VPPVLMHRLLLRARITVDRYNKYRHRKYYAIGDMLIWNAKYPHGHPQLANVAINRENLALI